MTDHANVLEIRAKEDSHNNCYYSLASDFDYSYLLADKNDQSKSTQETDFIVDASVFEYKKNACAVGRWYSYKTSLFIF